MVGMNSSAAHSLDFENKHFHARKASNEGIYWLDWREIAALTASMSKLLRSARFGSSQLKVSTPVRRNLTIQLYCGVTLSYQGRNFESACVAIMLPSDQCKNRSNYETDSTMRFMSGLISDKPENHPQWEKRLFAFVSPDCAVGYERPGSYRC